MPSPVQLKWEICFEPKSERECNEANSPAVARPSLSLQRQFVMATTSSPRPQSPASSTRMQPPQVPQSPSNTPTSSVRTSLDLPAPTNARSSSPAPTSNAHNRNRAALRDYYNLKSKVPGPHDPSRTTSDASPTSAATITSIAIPDTATQPTDSASTSISTAALDDPSFEAEPYISSLLATANLNTVLKVEATLISEIRNLDGERKALVYDNYSKLIKATRTIGRMRMNMNGAGLRQGEIGTRARRAGDGGKGLSEDGMRDLGERVEGVRKLAEELGLGSEDGGDRPDRAGERKKAKEGAVTRQLLRRGLALPMGARE